MSKHAWLIWATPVALWAVYMCWLSGYQVGYEEGHDSGWQSAYRLYLPPKPAPRLLYPDANLSVSQVDAEPAQD